MEEYDQIFDWYVSCRNPDLGVKEIVEFCKSLAPGSTVLDVGCGDGIPASKCLIEKGFKVYGIDSSTKMIEQFKMNFPHAQVQCTALQDSNFFNLSFDAMVAWGMIFQCPQPVQTKVISKVAQNLRTGGRFLFNSGNEYGERISTMGGIKIPQYSMHSSQYKTILAENGMQLLAHYDEPSGSHVYEALKAPLI